MTAKPLQSCYHYIYLSNLSNPSVCSTVVLPALVKSDHVVSVSIDFLVNSKGNDPFHDTAYDYSPVNFYGVWSI